MVRRTVSLSRDVDAKILKVAEDAGSYSAAVARLVDEATKRSGRADRPSYMGSGEGPRDLGINAEKYLKEAIRRSSDNERPTRRARRR